jgi:hypothetical protein
VFSQEFHPQQAYQPVSPYFLVTGLIQRAADIIMNGTAASKIAGEVRDTDLLIDIPMAKCCTLLGFVDTQDCIRDGQPTSTSCGGLLVAAATDKLLWWKRLLLLPVVIFSNQDKISAG